MSKNILRWAFAIAALGLSSFLVVHGQIGISTLSVDVNLPPGGSFTGGFEVINNSDQAREFTVELKDYDRNIEGGLVLLDPGTHPRSLAKFLTFTPAKFSLPPKQKQLITFKIEIPSSEKGPHWAALAVPQVRRRLLERSRLRLRDSSRPSPSPSARPNSLSSRFVTPTRRTPSIAGGSPASQAPLAGARQTLEDSRRVREHPGRRSRSPRPNCAL
jgi:hypothetical protein